jgi:ubiquinone/menaquinone biosynthesis C-methylase UbiE
MDHKANATHIKVCCATFYQNDLIRMLVGDVLHPGGLELTLHLGTLMELRKGDRVLDVACGRGNSSVHLAESFGCHVIGLDYGQENIVAAESLAAERQVAHLTEFRQGDAEQLPFDDETFDAVISECSFCTFPSKHLAAAEMARVLKSSSTSTVYPGGRLGLTDITISAPLPEDIQSLLAWVACIAGASPPEQYMATLQEAGFIEFAIENLQNALQDMVTDVRRKILGAELAVGLGGLDLGDLDLEEGKRIAHRALELIQDGSIGYTLIMARKGNASETG